MEEYGYDERDFDQMEDDWFCIQFDPGRTDVSHLTGLQLLTESGQIFLGAWTPEAIGDSVGGPNHVLTTARSARFSSGLSVLDFMKRTTLAQMTPEALKAIGPAAETLAISESLEAHGLSVRARLNRLNE